LIRMTILMTLLATAVATAQSPTPGLKSVFKKGASSSGWIDCIVIEAGGIYLPVKINGHDTMASLYGGPSSVDVKMASSLGLSDAGQSVSEMSGLRLELGDLVLLDFRAKDAELQRPSQIVGQPVPLLLGEEIFQGLAVEIDFLHHRIAFRDAAKVATPKGAVDIPILDLNGEHLVPVSVNGAPPAQFELELGNTSGPLLTSPAYAKEHRLLEGVKTSQRLSGQFIETIVTVNHLGFAGVETLAAPVALMPESQAPPPSIAGGVGLPLLDRFDMIIDYPHDRIYATPHKDAASAVFFKDRLGLVIARQNGTDFVVTFVSPGSPAADAGFKIGDKISSINGKTAETLPFLAMGKLRFTEVGRVFTLRMDDGSERKVTAADFF
jgi:hypothetical protein